MSRTSTPTLLTISEARKQLESRGESVAAFARRKNVKPTAVYQVLYGHNKGRRGESHRAAVALGIKAGLLQ